jgi:hypothetical protein
MAQQWLKNKEATSASVHIPEEMVKTQKRPESQSQYHNQSKQKVNGVANQRLAFYTSSSLKIPSACRWDLCIHT